jgi:hypothetical protein
MSLLLAIFLIFQGGVHVGYLCSRSWPFVATDPWLVTGLGASADAVHTVGVALVLVSFFAYLLAALTAIRLLPSRHWMPLIVVASVASAIVLVVFVTPSTLLFLAVDAVLLWATLVRGWQPRRRTDTPRPEIA